MKYLLSILIALICFVWLSSCKQSNQPVVDETENIVLDSTDTIYAGPPPAPDPPNAGSPFYKLGCCNDAEKIISDCCCLEVLTLYEKMRKAKDSNLASLKQTDVILGNCYNSPKYNKKFNAIDYPKGDDDF